MLENMSAPRFESGKTPLDPNGIVLEPLDPFNAEDRLKLRERGELPGHLITSVQEMPENEPLETFEHESSKRFSRTMTAAEIKDAITDSADRIIDYETGERESLESMWKTKAKRAIDIGLVDLMIENGFEHDEDIPVVMFHSYDGSRVLLDGHHRTAAAQIIDERKNESEEHIAIPVLHSDPSGNIMSWGQHNTEVARHNSAAQQ